MRDKIIEILKKRAWLADDGHGNDWVQLPDGEFGETADEILALYSRDNCTLVPTSKLKEMQSDRTTIGFPMDAFSEYRNVGGKKDWRAWLDAGKPTHNIDSNAENLKAVVPSRYCNCRDCKPELWDKDERGVWYQSIGDDMKSKINILGYEHTVEIKPRSEIGGAGRSALAGQVIELDSGLCEEQIDSTLIHEVIEQISMHLNLALDELQICGLEVGMYSFLKAGGIDIGDILKNQ